MLTPRQASERLGLSLSLVYGWIESRQLCHYRMGAKGKRGRIMIAEADLLASIERLKVEAVQDQPAVRLHRPSLVNLKLS